MDEEAIGVNQFDKIAFSMSSAANEVQIRGSRTGHFWEHSSPVSADPCGKTKLDFAVPLRMDFIQIATSYVAFNDLLCRGVRPNPNFR